MAYEFEKKFNKKMENLARFSPESDFVYNYLVFVAEIMNSYESYIDALDSDDVTKAQKISEEISSHIDVQISSGMLGKNENSAKMGPLE